MIEHHLQEVHSQVQKAHGSCGDRADFGEVGSNRQGRLHGGAGLGESDDGGDDEGKTHTDSTVGQTSRNATHRNNHFGKTIPVLYPSLFANLASALVVSHMTTPASDNLCLLG